MCKLTATSISTIIPVELVKEARQLAEVSAAKYSGLVDLKKSPYHQNTVHSHFIGKIGEIGAAQAFNELRSIARQDIKVEDVFRNDKRDAECDLIINDMRIEVKCWKPYAVELYGVCVSDRQAKKLGKKCDAVVYCTFDERSNTFELIGWNTIEDIETTPSQLTGPKNNPAKMVMNRVMKSRMITELPIFTHHPA